MAGCTGLDNVGPVRGDAGVAAAFGVESKADYARLRDGVLTLLRVELRDHALADDLCNETFRIVLERLERQPLEDPSRLAAYLAQTARYLAGEHRKKLARRRTVTGQQAAIEATADTRDGQEDALQLDARARAVREVLEEMRRTRDREILVRVYLHDQDKGTVCRELGIGEEHYKRVLHRARSRLADLLQRRYRRSDFFCIALV